MLWVWAYHLRELVKFYFEHGPHIFHRIPVWTYLKSLLFARYSKTNIENVLQKNTCFGQKLFGESKKRLVIPSYNIDTNNIYIFKTAHHKTLKRDHKIPAWKIARATTAAPTFFPISKNIDNIRLIDGGIWANNPAMVGLFEAVTILGISLKNIRIFSVGTTEELKKSSTILDTFDGWPFWTPNTIKLIMQAQNASISQQLKLLLRRNFLRINPQVPAQLFHTDKMNMDELFSFASTYSREESKNFDTIFGGYKSKTFTPIQKIERS